VSHSVSPFGNVFPSSSEDGGEISDPDHGTYTSSSSLKEAEYQIAENGEWEVFLIHDDNTRNAFVLPGEEVHP
jgi:hypothetical protein